MPLHALQRRQWLGLLAAPWLAAPALALLQGCAGMVGDANSNASNTSPKPQRLADGIYLLPGQGDQADASNLGRIGNAGFIVGPLGVLAIDTGTSAAHGQALLAAIRSVTTTPVRLALITHTRPEFLFGAVAFQAQGVPIHTHRRTAQLMAARCETCLKALLQQVGAGPMQGTTLVVPDQVFDTSLLLHSIGRPVRVLWGGHSSGTGDIAVLDETTGVLFGGGLVDNRRIPDIQDSDLPGWLALLDSLQRLPLTQVVPGHGPAGPPALLTTTERYLQQLQARARALVDAQASLITVPEASDLPEFAGWAQYDTIHRRNASIAFLRFEREQLLR